jgi:hypothetical protein
MTRDYIVDWFHSARRQIISVDLFARHVLPDGPQQELVVNVVEQTFDVEL